MQNVIGANLLAADAPDAPGHIVNIGNGSRTTLIELLSKICEVCGKDTTPIHEAARLGDVRDSQADISLARRVLGFEPTVDLSAGLQLTADWFRTARQAT